MDLGSKAAGSFQPDSNGHMNGIAATTNKKVHKKKSQKHKSRNDFSDVQRIELDSRTAPQTTIDLLKTATDLDDLSKKLGERLSLASTSSKTNGSHGADDDGQGMANGTGATTPPRSPDQPNHLDNQIDSPSSQSNMIYCGPAKTEVIHVAESGIESEGPSTANASPTSLASDVTSPKSLSGSECSGEVKIEYREYESELQMPDIIRLIQRDLSEPYSIYTYRYFIHNWPKLCFLAMHGDQCVGAIVCKLGMHRQIMKRGYIAMLAVDKEYRKLKIGTNLVQKAIEAMLKEQADEVVLETEITNTPALRLYENLGFVRDKRLFHYYLNGVDALRLKLWFR